MLDSCSMRLRTLLALSLALLSACKRSEEPRSPGDAQAAPPAAEPVTAEKSEPSAKPECVIPLASEAPRRAPNALHCPADPEKPPELARGYVLFVEAPGSPRLEVELARSEA